MKEGLLLGMIVPPTLEHELLVYHIAPLFRFQENQLSPAFIFPHKT